MLMLRLTTMGRLAAIASLLALGCGSDDTDGSAQAGNAGGAGGQGIGGAVWAAAGATAGGLSAVGGVPGAGGPSTTGGVLGTGGGASKGGAAGMGTGGTGASTGGAGALAGTGGLPSDAGVGGRASICTAYGREVPDQALAYYQNCNACYCNAGAIWCNQSGCPAPDSGLYTCPNGLLSMTYGRIGGHVVYQESSTMDVEAWSYTHTRAYVSSATPSLSCTRPLPPCYAAAGTALAKLRNDLAAAEVSDALALSTPPLFGYDERPVDGTVFSISRSDGHGILVGSPCPSDATSCTPIPASVQQLVDDLLLLDRQMLVLQVPVPDDCAVFGE